MTDTSNAAMDAIVKWKVDFDDGYCGDITDEYGFENPPRWIVRDGEIIIAECSTESAATTIIALRAGRDKFEAAFWEAESRLATMTAERDAWKAQCEAVQREAEKCFSAQEEIDAAWDAFGTSGNRKTLSLAEQIASHQREVDDARAAYARGVHDAADRVERKQYPSFGDAQRVAYDIRNALLPQATGGDA